MFDPTSNPTWPIHIATPKDASTLDGFPLPTVDDAHEAFTVDDKEAYYVYIHLPGTKVWRKIVTASLYEGEKRVPSTVAREHAAIQSAMMATYMALSRLQAGIVNPHLNPCLPVSSHAAYDKTVQELEHIMEKLFAMAVLQYCLGNLDVSACSGTANMRVLMDLARGAPSKVCTALEAKNVLAIGAPSKVYTVFERKNVLATIAQRNAGLIVLFDIIAPLHHQVGHVLRRTRKIKGEPVRELTRAADDAFADLYRALEPLNFHCKIPHHRF